MDSLEQLVLYVQERLSSKQPIEMAIYGTIQRILAMIREESMDLDTGADSDSDDQDEGDFRHKMKSNVRQGISELIEEQETAGMNIATQAFDHIHSKYLNSSARLS
jgi:translation initiation factor 2B subunit (eIF-2B alpha/beta/delta family)